MYSIIVPGGSVPTARSISLRSVAGNITKWVTSIQYGTFYRNSYIPRAVGTLSFGLSVCIRPMVMIPLQEVSTISGNSVSAGILAVLRLELPHGPVLWDWTTYATFCLISLTGLCLCLWLVPVLSVSTRLFSVQGGDSFDGMVSVCGAVWNVDW